MRLWGGILPFIGYKTLRVTPALRRDLDLPPYVTHVDQFYIEWLNRGIGVIRVPAELE